ncbi:hypothetical protein BDR26DRAFT_848851 [Obelidium mucronatum]|nr:hypothetical protein BDR26DRAFT_848851 [Obelidium mucronatum]
MAQTPSACFDTISAYGRARGDAFFGNSDYCAQGVMDAMIPYYNACSNKAQSFYGFDSRNSNYDSPQAFQAFCLSKYNIALNGQGLPVVAAVQAVPVQASPASVPARTTVVVTAATGVASVVAASPTASSSGSSGPTSSGGSTGSSTSSNGSTASAGMSTTTYVGIGVGVLVVIGLVSWWLCGGGKPMKRRHEPVHHSVAPGFNGGPTSTSTSPPIQMPTQIRYAFTPNEVAAASTVEPVIPLPYGSFVPVNEPPSNHRYGNTPASTSNDSYVAISEPIRAAPSPLSIHGQSSSSSAAPAPSYAYNQVAEPIRVTAVSEKEREAQEDVTARIAAEDAPPPQYQELPDHLR